MPDHRFTTLEHLMRFRARPIALALAAALATACGDSNGPDNGGGPTPPGTARPETQLNFVRFGDTFDAPTATTVSVLVTAGDESEVDLFYRQANGNVVQLAELEIEDGSLLGDARRPNGQPFALGDTITITLTIVNPSARQYDFRFAPAGLRFNTADPAILEIEYEDADDDQKRTQETNFGIWRQEQNGQPFTRLNSVQFLDLDDLEVPITGFTRYAIAY